MGDVVSLNLSHAQSRPMKQDYDFTRGLDEALGSVAVVLRAVEVGDSSRTCLNALNTSLLDLLVRVERAPLIEAAVDQLAWAARRLVAARQCEGQPNPEWYDELGSAYLRLRSGVALAKPRSKTLQTG